MEYIKIWMKIWNIFYVNIRNIKVFFIMNYKKYLYICLNEVYLMLDCVLRRFLIRDIKNFIK